MNNSKTRNMQKILQSDSGSKKRRVKRAINTLEIGDYYKGTVKVLRKVKPGPLILSIFDGTGTIDAVAHDSVFENNRMTDNQPKTYNFGNVLIKDNRKPTQNAEDLEDKSGLSIDQIHVDDIVKIFGKVGMHRDSLEIEIKTIRASSMDFEDIIRTQSKPERENFSIDSERYESMKTIFLSIAQRIRRAIIEEQPILIRHHNDADGICAGLAIDEAIRNVMARRDLTPKHRLYRSPNISPFYDEIDLFRDISKFNRYTEEFGDKSPLILFLDTGSTPENVFPLKVLHSFNFECIIVDHHNPGVIENGKSQVCPFLQFHLNPYLFGWDSETCGGMLAYELARFIDKEYDKPLYPAVAAIGDRTAIKETQLLIEKSGKTKDELFQMAMVIDYLAYNLRFDSGDSIYDKIFSNENFTTIVAKEVEHMFTSTLERILPHIETQKIKNILLTQVNLESYTQRGQYPTAGKVLGLVHDYLKEQHTDEIIFTTGFLSDGVIIRASEAILPVPDLLLDLQQSLPNANVDGGGHEQAGSLKFIPAYTEDIKKFIETKLAEL